MIKINIISGFLGAGKTTVIKHLISQCFTNEKVVLIENEFGDIGIDGHFLKDTNIEMKEINSGCICCSLSGDFELAIQQIAYDLHPDRISIEPTGVAKLSDIIAAINESNEHHEFVIESATTVIDILKFDMYLKNFGEFYRNQIEYAHQIILTHLEKTSPERIQEIADHIKAINTNASIMTTPWSQLSNDKILDFLSHKNDITHLMKKTIEEHHHHHHDHEHHHEHDHDHHHHHHDEPFVSWSIETSKVFSKDQLESILDKLAQDSHILRVKGLVSGDNDCWYYFDGNYQEYELYEGTPDYTGKICVIGDKLDEGQLEGWFNL